MGPEYGRVIDVLGWSTAMLEMKSNLVPNSKVYLYVRGMVFHSERIRIFGHYGTP